MTGKGQAAKPPPCLSAERMLKDGGGSICRCTHEGASERVHHTIIHDMCFLDHDHDLLGHYPDSFASLCVPEWNWKSAGVQSPPLVFQLKGC